MNRNESITSAKKFPEIAIVGMATLFPKALNNGEFWKIILDKSNTITENEDFSGYWNRKDHYDPDPKAVDKTYATKAGFIPEINFDPMEFKIPPRILESISAVQLFSVYVAKQALRDAGILDAATGPVSKDRIGVILGAGGNGNTSFPLAARLETATWKKVFALSGIPDKLNEHLINQLRDLYPSWHEDSFPGFLGNVISGRVASTFDLGGTNCTVDAACASSLAAIKVACGELADGACDAVLTGGVNVENSAFSFVCFSKTPALSRTGACRPYDANADGMLLGDGLGMFVLKRLVDAKRHGDRIYAVIKGIASSSDGRAKSIFAPRYEGQVRAFQRAYQAAGLSPADVQLVEGHGTGTAAGDATEFRSLCNIFQTAGARPQSVALGSVKSQIGHARSAAGAASVAKVALALHHKVFPPTINVSRPHPEYGFEKSPFYLNTSPRPWIQTPEMGPRRAAVSSFGFGGTNYHLILEEFSEDHQAPYRLNPTPDIVVIHAGDPQALLEKCDVLVQQWQSGNGPSAYQEFLKGSDGVPIPPGAARLAFVSRSAEEASDLLTLAIEQCRQRTSAAWEHPRGIYYRPVANDVQGKVVAMFPGQGSQYLNMAAQMAIDFPEMREMLARTDAALLMRGLFRISELLYPCLRLDGAAGGEQPPDELTQTRYVQPMIGAVSAGYYKILQTLKFKPDFVLGHSFGELSALWASGALDDEQFATLAVERGMAMEATDNADADRGAMLAVKQGATGLEDVLKDYPDVRAANFNSPKQTVVAGSVEAIRSLSQRLVGEGVENRLLPVAAAFHTPFVKHAQRPFAEKLADVPLHRPAIPVYANVTGAPYSGDPDEIRDGLCQQILNPVRFQQSIEAIYAAGGRVFVEVGPKGVLSALVAEILGDRPHITIPVNSTSKRDDVVQFKQAVARLIVAGVDLSSVDPYRLDIPALEGTSKVTVRLNGGLYMSAETEARRLRVLTEHDSTVFDECVREFAESKKLTTTTKEGANMNDRKEPFEQIDDVASDGWDRAIRGVRPPRESSDARVEPHSGGNGSPALRANGAGNKGYELFRAALTAQSEISHVHLQFQRNQERYIQLLDKFFGYQHSLINEFKDQEKFASVMNSLGEGMGLLEKSQDHYHANHREYFQNHIALLNGLAGQSVGSGSYSLDDAAIQDVTEDVQVQERHDRSAERSVSQAVAPSSPHAPAPDNWRKIVDIPVPKRSVQPAPDPVSNELLPTVGIPTPRAETFANTPGDKPGTAMVAKFDEVEFTKCLVQMVSEKTGYPTDMIDLDMDLEADMGIDSIKRVEIIGALAASYQGLKISEAEFESLDIGEFSTLRMIVEFTKKRVNVAANPVQTAAELAQDATVLEGERVTDRLPGKNQNAAPSDRAAPRPHAKPAFLVLSAKRGSTGAEFQLPHGANVRTQTAQHEPKPATRAIGSDSGTGSSRTGQAEAEGDTDPEPAALAVRRFVVRPKKVPYPDWVELTIPDGHACLVSDDGSGLAQEVAARLKKENVKVVLLSMQARDEHSRSGGKEIPPAYSIADKHGEEFETAFADLLEKEAPVGGFVHVQARRGTNPRAIKEALDAADCDTAEKIFLAAKHLKKPLVAAVKHDGRPCFVVVTRMDGCLGLGATQPYRPVDGSLAGLVKSLHREWPGVFCKAIDVGPDLDRRRAGDVVLEELHDSRDSDVEIGRDGGHRYILGLDEAQAEPVAGRRPPGKDSVFLVTGGGRGITARCTIDLAGAFGSTFLLLGRTDIDAPEPKWAVPGGDEVTLRQALIAHLQAVNKHSTPTRIETELRNVLSAREVKSTLKQVEAAGGIAVYLSVDVHDKARLAELLARAQEKHGRINGLIHGAGNLADKKIERKTREDFRSVFGTKVEGLLNLLSVLDPSRLDFLVMFSSVSAYYGNAGQSDYAMANEVLNKLSHCVRWFQRDIYVNAINWGPWESGMVTPALKEIYRERDIPIIPVDVGSKFLVTELSRADTGAPQVLIGGKIHYPIEARRPIPQELTLHRRLRLQDNPFLLDHRVERHAVLPATCAIGWMVSSCEGILPNYRFKGINEFRVQKGVVFDKECPTEFFMILQPTASPDASYADVGIRVVIQSRSAKKALMNHYSAVLSFTNAPIAEPPRIESPKTVNRHADLGCVYSSADTRGMLFHGDSFRGVQVMLRCDANAIVSRCRLAALTADAQGQFRASSFNPFTADVQLHNNLIWMIHIAREGGLPLAIASMEQYRCVGFDEDFYVSTAIRSHKDRNMIADIIVHDLDGRIASRWTGVQFTSTRALTKLFVTTQSPDR